MNHVDRELAPAKINLTLEIVGRRDDGYHDLNSLVVFARDVHDVVDVEEDAARSRCVFHGPFSSGILPENNTVEDVVSSLSRYGLTLHTKLLRVEKNIPSAAGLGGGSADAAAVVRLAQRLCPDLSHGYDGFKVAREVGADVPVCLASCAQVMQGTGERLTTLPSFPEVYTVLVNAGQPAVADKTKRVFATFAKLSTTNDPTRHDPGPKVEMGFQSADDVAAFVRARGNDLSSAATALMPKLTAPRDALSAQPECLVTGLTGAGPTVFGLFRDHAQALAAAARLQRQEPGWWVKASGLM